jgi:hypothetical protein
MIYNIQEAASMPYSELSLNKPMVLHGTHIMKLAVKRDSTSMPFYVQLPECKMIKTATKKRGSSSTGACELVFAEDDITSISVLEFAEKMEEKSREMILENRSWFDTELEASEIERFFIQTLKWSRANKNYSWKGINIASNLTIYNDSGERGVELEDVNSDTRIICILEIRGIRFSANSFQLEAEIKQILVTQNTPLFEKCLIPTIKSKNTIESSGSSSDAQTIARTSAATATVKPEQSEQPKTPEQLEQPEQTNEVITADAAFATREEKENTIVSIFDSVAEDSLKDDLEIMDLIPVSSENPMKLKTRTEVYKKMYEDAVLKATNAKRVALLAYLEAKKIKKTYMLLENMQADDSESLNGEGDELNE